MDMSNKAMFQNNSYNWSTPIDLFDELDAEFGFDLDACASEDNHKCVQYYTKEDDGLTKNWGGVWCSAIPRIPRLASGLRNVIARERKIIQLL